MHNNVRLYAAALPHIYLKWEVFSHPPYSPGLAPSDLHFLFSGLKKLLGGRHFLTDAELREVASMFFEKQNVEFCYNKCLYLLGGFVEK